MPGPVLVPDTFWIEEPVFLFYRTHTGNYMHALVDDYLGSSPRFLPAIRAAMHVHPACALGPWACWQTMRLLAAFFWRQACITCLSTTTTRAWSRCLTRKRSIVGCSL